MRFGPAILCVALLATPVWAADQLAFGPVAAWVVPQQLAAAQGSDEAPVTVLLYDSQAKLDPGRSATYLHYAMRINNAQGLSAANVAAAWDPAFETATVHRLAIRRGATIIDVLASGQKFTLLRREQNLEQQTLDGRLTATIQPEGVQVGDIVEVQVTIVRTDPTLKDHMEVAGQLSMPMPVTRAQIRVVTPAGTPLRQRLTGLGPPAVEQKDGMRTLTWAVTGLQPQTGPAFAPDRFAIDRRVELTAFQSWDDLAALFVPLFARAATIAPGSPLHQEVARIKAASGDPAIRAGLALQLVQDKVRYVNLALGIGGLVPTEADRTWQRRFGDCKAKTALLVALLRELGIEGVPVLVHSSLGDGLDARLPMVAQFDHVIVRTTIGGRDYWLDGTRSGDSSVALLKVPFYRWGLPLGRNAQLVRIQPAPLTRPVFETIIHTDASGGANQPVPTTLEFIFRGDNAIAQNQLMSSLDPALRDTAQREQLKAELDRFDIAKVESSFDADALIYRLRGEGRQSLTISGSDGTYWSEVPSLGYKADFRRTHGRDRDAPVAVTYPSFSRTMQTIVLPKDLVSRITFQTPPTSVSLAGVEYRRTVTNKGGIVTIDNHVRSLVPEIPHAEAVAAEARLRELDDDHIWIRLGRPKPSSQDVQKLIGKEPKSWSDYEQAATKYMMDDQPLRALAMLDRAVELAPGQLHLLSWRAQLRQADGDLTGALADAEEYLRKHPQDPHMRELRAGISWGAGNVSAALADAKALEGVDKAVAQVARGRILVALGQTDQGISAFKAALEIENDPLTHVLIANSLPARDTKARRAALDAALALNPTDMSSLVGLAHVALQLGDPSRALTLLDQAFLKSPDDITIRNIRAVAMSLAGKSQQADREFEALAAKELSAIELNSLCWNKTIANSALDRALRECDRSLALSDSAATRDSKAMVLLRMKRWDDAIREYDAVLQKSEIAFAFYGRAIALARKGERARSDADAARALKLSPGIERVYGYYGLTR